MSAIDIDNRLIDARELAEHLGINLGLVYRWSSDGRIPRYKLGHKTVRFRLCEVLRVFREEADAPFERAKAEDVTDTLEMALEVSGCDRATVVHKPRLLSDNGSSYIAGELADWLDERNMRHTRGAPYHPQTQGKIERWHQTLKNRILLENYYLPGDLEAQIEAFVAHYNHRRYHESLNNLTPADVYFGRGQTILLEREKIKRRTIEHRRLQHRKNAA